MPDRGARPPAPVRCDSIHRLTDPAFLSKVVGPVAEVERATMGTPGFSGSTHTRFGVRLGDGDQVSLVLKHTSLASDWTAYRSEDDLGREAMLLATPELAGVWDVFACPYVAYAIEPGAVGLLMHDLTPHLLPDAREPLDVATENALLRRLARMHALYWEAPALPPWLARHALMVSVLGPVVLADDLRPPLPSPLRERVVEGWAEAFRRLPAGAAELLRRPAEEHERMFAHLPCTVVHGDVKVANFALLPGGRVAAFDWAMVGRAPASVDIGWYLAVNASRLARPKEQVLAHYRALLEDALSEPIADPTWFHLGAAAVLCGALMLLWSKALALRDGRPGAREEWEWWVSRLPA